VVIEESLFRATLVTRGRVTGKTHSVILKGVKYNDKIYFSRHRPDVIGSKTSYQTQL